MTRIFISHRHSDEAIAYKLVNFLLAAIKLEEEDILCTSNPDQGLSYSASSITDQLKNQLKNSEALIILITIDSLHSAWIPFETGAFWTTDKPVIPILGPSLSQNDLPGPLSHFLSISIESSDSAHKLNNAINQLTQQLKVEQRYTKRRNDTLDEFSRELKAWKSRFPQPDIPSPEEIESLNNQLKELDESLKKLQRDQALSQQEKEELKQSYQQQKQELEQLHRSQIQQLEQQLEQERFRVQEKIAEQEQIIAQLQEQIKQLPASSKEPQKLELTSAKGIDYTKLEELLRQQKWKEADRETYVCMITAVGKKEGDYFWKEDIDNFPCEDLRTIDQLWVQYSQGRFGFSVQKNIWLEVGGKVDVGTEIELGDRVGWRQGGEWMKYNSLQFDLSAPPGHLPGRWCLVGFVGVVRGLGLRLVLLSRKDL